MVSAFPSVFSRPEVDNDCNDNYSSKDDYVFDNDYDRNDATQLLDTIGNRENNDYTDIDLEILESTVTENEILDSIGDLKSSKSPGPDLILVEMIKCTKYLILPFWHKFFNHIFDSGIYPSFWTQSIIVPIHKKGDTKIPDNYRGISLTCILGKVFTSILNKRLTMWANIRDVIPETQAGFRKGYSTADHIFTLYAIIQKYLTWTTLVIQHGLQR